MAPKNAPLDDDENKANIIAGEMSVASRTDVALLTVHALHTKQFPGAGISGWALRRSSLACFLYSQASKASAARLPGADDKSTWVRRRRMKTKPVGSSSTSTNSGESDGRDDDESEGYETAVFVPGEGLVGGWFYHQSDPLKKFVREDRAVLFQSLENIQRLKENPLFSSCFDGVDYLQSPSFGEQVIVSGCEVSRLAIGDVFRVEGGLSALVVEITAPRKPCYKMNKSNGTGPGARGIQSFAHRSCLGGWFARVLVGGELRDGMKLARTASPNPRWTLPRTNEALYGEGTRLQSNMAVASWNRGRDELAELVGLPQLGECEWKAEARKLLLRMDGVDVRTVGPDVIDPFVDPVRVRIYQFLKQYCVGHSRLQKRLLVGSVLVVAILILFNHIVV